MDKIKPEEIKKGGLIIKHFKPLEAEHYPINLDEPESDENRLLTDEEIKSSCAQRWKQLTGQDINGVLVDMVLARSICEAQLAKDMEWEDKRGFIKEAEYQEKIEEIFKEIDTLIPDHKYAYWIDEVGRQQKKHDYGFCVRCEFESLKAKVR